MNIRELQPIDLSDPQIAVLGNEFMRERHSGYKFNAEHFARMIGNGLDTGVACGWVIVDPQLVGIIIGVKYNCIFTAKLRVAEILWYVLPNYRGKHSIDLFNKFEKWARAQDADSIQTAHACDHKGLGRFFEIHGYTQQETTLIKRLCQSHQQQSH